jgi:hypothetical protein
MSNHDEIREQAVRDAQAGRYSPPGSRSIIGDVVNAMLKPVGLSEDEPSADQIAAYDETHKAAKAAGGK